MSYQQSNHQSSDDEEEEEKMKGEKTVTIVETPQQIRNSIDKKKADISKLVSTALQTVIVQGYADITVNDESDPDNDISAEFRKILLNQCRSLNFSVYRLNGYKGVMDDKEFWLVLRYGINLINVIAETNQKSKKKHQSSSPAVLDLTGASGSVGPFDIVCGRD